MLTGKTPRIRYASPLQFRGKALGKKQEKPMTKAEKRMAEWSQHDTTTIAKSAAHLGAVERPSEQNISKLLDIRRAQAHSRGTSVGRLKKWWEEEEQQNTGVNEEEAKKRYRQNLQLKPKISSPTPPNQSLYGDLD